ncbi:MAG: hydrogenase formation protein HypD [Pseudomonadota bacterium]
MSLSRLKSPDVARRLAEKIRAAADSLQREKIRIMHVCGTHEDTVSRYGIRALLPGCIEIIPGPGCPVCVTTSREIDESLDLARRAVITTFGDLLKVPGSRGQSLMDEKAAGADVRVVYSIFDALAIARETDRETVFVAVGFETTAPSTASIFRAGSVPENFSVLMCHRLVPPAMELLLRDRDAGLDGFINPGHVSAIIGTKAYEALGARYGVPQVVAGFEPYDVLLAILMLLTMIRKGEGKVRNEYTRVVRPEGNVKAQELMAGIFEPTDVDWRGFPVIERSGLALKDAYARYDARKKYGLDVKSAPEISKGCICGKVLKGTAYPDACRLFGKDCTPRHPVGACMVSSEGSCGIWYRCGKF